MGVPSATVDLTITESSGMESEMRTNGYYCYLRYPQLVCLHVTIVGVVLAGNSLVVTVIAAAMAGWILSMPLSEKP